MNTAITPTREQQAIIDAYNSTNVSLMVTARAGCTKTTMLTLVANASPDNRPGCALAYNVRIKKELEVRFPKHFQVMTLNGLGHRAWSSTINKRLEVKERKLGEIVTQVLKRESIYDKDMWALVRQAVSKCQLIGLIPKRYEKPGLVPDADATWTEILAEFHLDTEGQELVRYLALQALSENIKQAWQGVVSYDDQIYMPSLFGGFFPRFPVVMLDEAQDVNTLQRLMVAKTAMDRLVVVGDDKQSIYVFRGADSESMARLRDLRAEWIDLPLSTTFRCPSIIVKRQHWHVPLFSAAESNAQGAFLALSQWNAKTLDKYMDNGTVAVLCRNNAPLLALAFKLLRNGIAVTVAGRDIGARLVALAKRINKDAITAKRRAGNDEPITPTAVIIDWQERETQLALANNDEARAETTSDLGGSLMAVLSGSGAETMEELINALKDLFAKENGQVLLSTGHRAKGLEWDTVIHLDPWRIPSRIAQQKGGKELQQEHNLKYVIETRTKCTLIEANLQDFED
jgi:superfamily I DNA/RNA helicase